MKVSGGEGVILVAIHGRTKAKWTCYVSDGTSLSLVGTVDPGFIAQLVRSWRSLLPGRFPNDS